MKRFALLAGVLALSLFAVNSASAQVLLLSNNGGYGGGNGGFGTLNSGGVQLLNTNNFVPFTVQQTRTVLEPTNNVFSSASFIRRGPGVRVANAVRGLGNNTVVVQSAPAQVVQNVQRVQPQRVVVQNVQRVQPQRVVVQNVQRVQPQRVVVQNIRQVQPQRVVVQNVRQVQPQQRVVIQNVPSCRRCR